MKYQLLKELTVKKYKHKNGKLENENGETSQKQ